MKSSKDMDSDKQLGHGKGNGLLYHVIKITSDV